MKTAAQSGNYQVLRLIGEGGMGSVYEAEAPDGNQRVAIKLVKSGIEDERYLKRFLREIEVCKTFAHPYVVKIIDGGLSKRIRLFLVSYIHAHNLVHRDIKPANMNGNYQTCRAVS